VGRAGYLIQCVEMSLRRLRLDRIDLYQLHRIDPRTPLEESLGALKRMQEQGKIRHIGLSEVAPAEIEAARKIVVVTTVQNRYSLADRRHEETLVLRAQGIGFLPWYPINAGKLLKPDNPSAQALARIRRPPLGNGGPAFAGLALAALAGDAADSGHVEGCAFGGECRGGRIEVERGGVDGAGEICRFLIGLEMKPICPRTDLIAQRGRDIFCMEWPEQVRGLPGLKIETWGTHS
jgi:hypothetical protein